MTDNTSEKPNPAIDHSKSKRYWLFSWYQYEADGGMFDFMGSFDSTQEALQCAADSDYSYDRGMIFDSEVRENIMVLHVTKGWITLD